MIYIDNDRIVDIIQKLHRVISLIFSLICIILIVYRYSLNTKTKNIGYLLKLRNNLFDGTTAYIYLAIEIIIHLIQPYPGIQFDWVVKTLGIDVSYNINAILTSIIVIRMYVYMRISKFFNMFYGEDIKAFNHFEISSIYMFLYRCNIRYRPFVTIFVIFLFFFLIWSIMFISYERFENNGLFKFTWNVFWLIAVTVTTSNIF